MNIDPRTTKYLIKAKIQAEGIVDKPDVVGAIFGQTEGLLGDELDLRDLQKSGRLGRIEVEVAGVELTVPDDDQRIVADFASDGVGRDVEQRVGNPKVAQIGQDEVLEIGKLTAVGIHQHDGVATER